MPCSYKACVCVCVNTHAHVFTHIHKNAYVHICNQIPAKKDKLPTRILVANAHLFWNPKRPDIKVYMYIYIYI